MICRLAAQKIYRAAVVGLIDAAADLGLALCRPFLCATGAARVLRAHQLFGRSGRCCAGEQKQNRWTGTMIQYKQASQQRVQDEGGFIETTAVCLYREAAHSTRATWAFLWAKTAKLSSRGSAPHPAGAQPQTPARTHVPVTSIRECRPIDFRAMGSKALFFIEHCVRYIEDVGRTPDGNRDVSPQAEGHHLEPR